MMMVVKAGIDVACGLCDVGWDLGFGNSAALRTPLVAGWTSTSTLTSTSTSTLDHNPQLGLG